jgi:hypothetical protein
MSGDRLSYTVLNFSGLPMHEISGVNFVTPGIFSDDQLRDTPH